MRRGDVNGMSGVVRSGTAHGTRAEVSGGGSVKGGKRIRRRGHTRNRPRTERQGKFAVGPYKEQGFKFAAEPCTEREGNGQLALRGTAGKVCGGGRAGKWARIGAVHRKGGGSERRGRTRYWTKSMRNGRALNGKET